MFGRPKMISFEDIPELSSEEAKKAFLKSLRSEWDIEAETVEGKVCPLRRKQINGKEYFGPCYQAKCAMWDETNGRCNASISIQLSTR